MIYKIILTKEAEEDILKLKHSGDKIALRKLALLLDELEIHPKKGMGNPEQLKHNFSGCWSRKITPKHRIIYKIQEEIVTVIVLSSYGHYSDK